MQDQYKYFNNQQENNSSELETKTKDESNGNTSKVTQKKRISKVKKTVPAKKNTVVKATRGIQNEVVDLKKRRSKSEKSPRVANTEATNLVEIAQNGIMDPQIKSEEFTAKQDPDKSDSQKCTCGDENCLKSSDVSMAAAEGLKKTNPPGPGCFMEYSKILEVCNTLI